MGTKKDLKKLFTRFLLVVVYCVLGAAIFYAIEHTDNYEDDEKNRKKHLLNTTKTKIMRRFGINESEFDILKKNIIEASSYTPLKWTYTRGIDLCWQTITTIGYGNKPPTTIGGQLFLIPYAIIGIPLTIFMLNTVGQNICHFVSFIITGIEKNLSGREETKGCCKVKLLFSVSCLTFALLVFMAGVSIKTEGWTFGEGLYAWFVTFSTVGFGDYIPGNGTDAVDSPIAILYRVIFVLIGLSLISTFFNAITDLIEDKRKKAEHKSWVRFVISSLTCERKGNVNDKDVTEMTEHQTVNNQAV